MHYFSTNRSCPNVSFRQALMDGQPSDKGLYFPCEIPRFDKGYFDRFGSKQNAEIAFDVIRPYITPEIAENDLFAICEETVNFDFPLVPITDRISALELFHGPTLAFKDVGARFMSRCLRHFSRGNSDRTLIIVATSGDTGGAVAAGFHGVEGIDVVILFPKGKVSKVQDLQLTTFGGNVTTLELHGTFDDCQALAKQALADRELQARVNITSANSINVGRWLPQQFYYFFALKQWEGQPPVISVPSGNFGNLASGLLAWQSGLPVKRFIAACNANDVVPRFMKSDKYSPQPSIETLSNAMDVGDPSNFVRILELFRRDIHKLRGQLSAESISDEDTAETMRQVFEQYGYILDPHGAVGFRALSNHFSIDEDQKGIFLETADPVKFDKVNEIIGDEVPTPAAIKDLYSRKRSSIEIKPEYKAVRDILFSKL